MIIPIGTDRDGRRPANAVRLIILLNVLVAIAASTGAARWLCTPAEIQRATARLRDDRGGEPSLDTAEREAFARKLTLTPGRTPWWTWLTALFTHDPFSLLHLLGNMIFLWAFGKPIESHLGFWRFLLLYVLGGLAGWVGHWLAGGGPVIGASGATSAVACLFVTFFPRSHTKLLFLIGMTLFVVPSGWLVATYFAIDVIRYALDRGGLQMSEVAAGAHLGGSVFGVVAGLALLRFGWAPRGEWDLLHLLRQAMRRRAMRAAFRHHPLVPPPNPRSPLSVGAPGAATGSGPGSGPGAAPGDRAGQREFDARRAQLRARLLDALRSGQAEATCAALRTLQSVAPQECLPADNQLDAANVALQHGEVALAAHAYALFLSAHRDASKAPEVRLLLASLYARRLQRRDEARALLVGLAERLSDPTQRALAEALAAECAAPASPPTA